jgi:hypothetical protein
MQMFNSKNRRMTIGRLIVICLFALFSAQLQATDKISYTGFLPHYPDLKPDPAFKGAYKWKNPERDLKKYNKIMVAPLEIWLSPDSEYKGLSADQIGLVNRMFQSKLTEVLEPDYPIVSQPGNDVLVLRVAMTNVNIKKRDRGVRQWLPPMLIYRGADALLNESLKGLELNDAQLEGAMRDSKTSDLIGARVVTGVGLEGKEMHFEGIMDFFEFRAKQFKAAMDAAHK